MRAGSANGQDPAAPPDAAGWLALAPPRNPPRHDRCPVTSDGARPKAVAWPAATAPGEVAHAAAAFIRQHHSEQHLGDPAARLAEVDAELAATGTYTHTPEELVFGARVAWRNANRCIGRLYWQSLRVRDLRHLTTAEEIAAACADHLREAAPDGRIRPLITVFAPDHASRPDDRPGPRIWNEQLIRYAGYVQRDGHVVGDPRSAGITAYARRLGWRGGEGTPFDVLPLLIETDPDEPPHPFELPADSVLEVALEHPEFEWWSGLGLR